MRGLCVLLLIALISSLQGWLIPTRFRKLGTRALYSSARPSTLKDTVQTKTKKAGLTALTAAGVFLGFSQTSLAAAPLTEKDFLKALATITTSKAIIKPIEGYVKSQAYDNARTNVKYLLNQLQIEKATSTLIKSALEFAGEPDALDDAQEVSAEVGNFLIQLDSTIYTVIFIPSDDSGGVPPSADKYLKMLFGYLANVDKALDKLLAVGSSAQLAEAKKLSEAQLKGLPDDGYKILFKTVVKKSSI